VLPAGAVSLAGTVQGGQQAIRGSRLQLYAAGDGSASTALLLQAVQTGGNGEFSIAAYYECLRPTLKSILWQQAVLIDRSIPKNGVDVRTIGKPLCTRMGTEINRMSVPESMPNVYMPPESKLLTRNFRCKKPLQHRFPSAGAIPPSRGDLSEDGFHLAPALRCVKRWPACGADCLSGMSYRAFASTC
jgi:hypothetical protein